MKYFFVCLIFACVCTSIRAQNVPQGIHYQAAVRGADGKPLSQKRITVRFSVRDGGINGPVVYSETHSTDTDDYGLFNLVIGEGNVITGSFSGVNWGQTQKFLQVEVDPSGMTNFKPLTTTRLLSVPYAVIADSALKGGGGGGDGWGSQSAVVLPPLTGSGTAANPIRLQASGGPGLPIWDGNQWTTAPLATDVTLSGTGIGSNPLSIARQGASVGQVLKWNGTAWAPADDDTGPGGTGYTAGAGINIAGGVISATDAVVGNEVVNATFGGGLVRSGDGSPGNPYTLGLPTSGVSAGQVMTWNGSNWAPATPQSGNITLTGAGGISVTPVSGSTFTISLPLGTVSGQVLTWNGSTWTAQSPPSGGTSYTAGNGISITGNQISHTIWTEAGANAYKTSGRVGIGTSNPGATLDVTANSTDAAPTLLINESENDFARLAFKNTAATPQWGIFARPNATGATGMLKFNYSSGNLDILTLTHDGKVGINNNSPNSEARFHMTTNTRLGGIFENDHTTDGNRAVALEGKYSSTQAFDGTGVRGTSEPQPGRGTGGRFYGGGIGAVGSVMQNFVGTYALAGVYGEAGTATTGQQGTRMGVYGLGTGGQYSIGVYGTANGATANDENYACYLNGNLFVEAGDVAIEGFISK
ncbi:MAG: hypothetical protein NZ534_04005, partial [Bacteroidia bacterium]|nr:hypothetical protein [Bacteroidia bacterium]